MLTTKNSVQVWYIIMIEEILGEINEFRTHNKYYDYESALVAVNGLNDTHENLKTGKKFRIMSTYEYKV